MTAVFRALSNPALPLVQPGLVSVKWAMVLFPIIGIFFWIAFLLVVLGVCGIFWVAGKTLWWFMDLPDHLDQRKAKAVSAQPRPAPPVRPQPWTASAPARPDPPTAPASPPLRTEPGEASGIWPKWTPAHRLYKDSELALWQEQFDALDSRR